MSNDSALDLYLDDVRRIRALKVGTAETSFYPAMGLFEQAQFRRDEAPAWIGTVVPERGVVEAKGAAHDIGGCQVPKKWLSYRDHSIIGRALSAEEAGHIQQTARRIAAVLLLGPNLDAPYRD